jgi:hypothetical protein
MAMIAITTSNSISVKPPRPTCALIFISGKAVKNQRPVKNKNVSL